MNFFIEANPTPQEPPRDLMRLMDGLGVWSSEIRIVDIAVNGGLLTIKWPQAAGRVDSVESSDDLSHWSVEASAPVLLDGSLTWTGTISAGARFYRITAP